jgi:hypothetical protein
MNKNMFSAALVSGIVLLLTSIIAIYAGVFLMPGLMEEYYTDVFRASEDRAWLFYSHPFILGFALSWFWNRFKEVLDGNILLRSLEFGVIYGVVATIPTMWITFSAIQVSFPMVASWAAFGVFQASIAGFINARLNA